MSDEEEPGSGPVLNPLRDDSDEDEADEPDSEFQAEPDDGLGARSHTCSGLNGGAGGVGVQRRGRRLVFAVNERYAAELLVLDGGPWGGAPALEQPQESAADSKEDASEPGRYSALNPPICTR